MAEHLKGLYLSRSRATRFSHGFIAYRPGSLSAVGHRLFRFPEHDQLGEPLLRSGKTRVFGRGNNPINFVSVEDVAQVVERAVTDAAMRGEIVEIGGPENLTMNQVASIFQRLSGKPGKVSHIPLPMMRVMSHLMSPLNPQLARQIGTAVVMDTADMTFDPSGVTRRFPDLTPTSIEEVARRDAATRSTPE